MPRPSRARRILKWTGAGVCALLAVLLVTGWALPGIWYTFSDGTSFGVQSHWRHVLIMFDDFALTIPATSRPAVKAGWQVGDFSQEWPEVYSFYFTFDVAGRIARMDHHHRLGVPHWLVLLVTAIPTAWLMVRDQRRIRPGNCLRCGYDLTGNISGVCSECGLAATSSP